jgi:hypothetical protein
VTRPRLADDPPAHEPVAAALREIGAHPLRTLLRHWNWKTASLSALLRATLFFVMTLDQGATAAAAAGLLDVPFRVLMAGLCGAFVQRLRRTEPRWCSVVAVVVIVPVVSHTAEALVHWRGATPHLERTMAVSVGLTGVTTLTDWWLMRRGLLLVGRGAPSLAQDVRRLLRWPSSLGSQNSKL